MAVEKHSPAAAGHPMTRTADASTAVPERRLSVMREATWEIGAMLELLLKTSREIADEQAFQIRGLALRMRELNSVVMSGVSGDDGRETFEMECVVRGQAGPNHD